MEPTDYTKYPSVNAAYDIAIGAYDWTVRRFDALDSKAQTLLGIVLTGSLAVPVTFSALKVTADKDFLLVALLFFVLALSIGTYSRLHGAITMISPLTLYKKWLKLPESKFKSDMIYFAGRHFDTNVALLHEKEKLLKISLLMFGLEIVSLCLAVAWDRS